MTCGQVTPFETMRDRAEAAEAEVERLSRLEARAKGILAASEERLKRDAELEEGMETLKREAENYLGRAVRAEAKIEAALEHCAQASVLLKQSHGDAEALKYVGLALAALTGEGKR